jgi:plasmid stabilization system protein ParE
LWPQKFSKASILTEHPLIGRPIQGRAEYRELFLEVLNATYVFRYVAVGERLVMLRVFHGREARDQA